VFRELTEGMGGGGTEESYTLCCVFSICCVYSNAKIWEHLSLLLLWTALKLGMH